MDNAITQHFDAHIGPASAHYAVYPGPSGMIHRIRPTEERPWTTLYTDGMRARVLPEPDELDDTRVELVVACPKGWFADDDGGPVQTSGADEGDWLVELLQYVMQLPWNIDYPVFAGLVLPNGDPAEPYADGIRFCAMLIAPVASLDVDAQDVSTEEGDVRLLSLVLLDEAELAYATAEGVEALYLRLDEHGVFEQVDPDRASVAP